MKKTALSLLVVAASGAYVWNQAGGAATVNLLAASQDIAFTGSIEKRNPTSAAAVPANETPTALPQITEASATKADKSRPAASLSTEPPPAPPLLPAVPTPSVPEPAVTPSLAEAPRLPAAPIEPVPEPVAIPVPRPRPADRLEAANGLVTRAAMSFASSATYADGAYTGPAVDAYYGYVQIQAIIEGGQLSRIKVLQYPSDRRTSVVINRQALPMLRDEVVSAQSADVDIISGATLTSEAFVRSLGVALRKAGS